MNLPVVVKDTVKGHLLVEYIPRTDTYRMYHMQRTEACLNAVVDVVESGLPFILEMWAIDKELEHLPIYHTDFLHRVDDSCDSLGFNEYVMIACDNAKAKSKN